MALHHHQITSALLKMRLILPLVRRHLPNGVILHMQLWIFWRERGWDCMEGCCDREYMIECDFGLVTVK